ncbi:MAG: DNA methyltransferase [Candidatus Sulfotelmatobacter sp.]|jgi:site-specific DNA-methyltransferase (adenine-specific)
MNEGCGRKFVVPASEDGWDPELHYPCCTIIPDDCNNHIGRFPRRIFDLVVTDPPYGMDITATQEHHGQIDWDASFPSLALAWHLDLPRLGTYCFCRWDNLWDYRERTGHVLDGKLGMALAAVKESSLGVEMDPVTKEVRIGVLPKPKSVLVWHKVGGGGGVGNLPHEHIRDYEMALFYPGRDHKFKKRPKSVLTYRAPGNDIHPTQKPPELIKEILGWYDFETVLDPYMGSGTTAVAAKELGKHFLGFEANETYYKRAIQRIAEIGK